MLSLFLAAVAASIGELISSPLAWPIPAVMQTGKIMYPLSAGGALKVRVVVPKRAVGKREAFFARMSGMCAFAA